MAIKINELGAIHNMFMYIFYCIIHTHSFDTACPPEPPRKNLIGQCICQAIPIYLADLVSLTTDKVLNSKLQVWADDCISARTIIQYSSNIDKIERAHRDMYDATVALAADIDDMIQKDNPDWIEKMDTLNRVLFTEETCNYDRSSDRLIIPTIRCGNKLVASYEKMFSYMEQYYH